MESPGAVKKRGVGGGGGRLRMCTFKTHLECDGGDKGRLPLLQRGGLGQPAQEGGRGARLQTATAGLLLRRLGHCAAAAGWPRREGADQDGQDRAALARSLMR